MRRWPVAVLLVAALLVAVLAAGAGAAKHDVTLASVASNGDKQNQMGLNGGVVVSGDGSRVAFTTTATNLDPDDVDADEDVYVRDLDTGITELISRESGPNGAKSDGLSFVSAISDNGRYVSFQSTAGNIHAFVTDNPSDAFVRDLQTDETILVSRINGELGDDANGSSRASKVTDDGRFVLFRSLGDNVHPDDLDTTSDIFLRDLHNHTTTLISRASGAAGPKGNGDSFAPAISSDGRFATFQTAATNLLGPADDDATIDIVRRNLDDHGIGLVSRAHGHAGAKGTADSTSPSISADGSLIAFSSLAPNLDPDANVNAVSKVFVRDAEHGVTTLVSRASGAAGENAGADSLGPGISGDGRLVAFWSYAQNLFNSDTLNSPDVFVRDLDQTTTSLVSRAAGPSGAPANGQSYGGSVSADGHHVAFVSEANNLSGSDTDIGLDVYSREIGPIPPKNLTPPTLSGVGSVGNELLCLAGEWSDGTVARSWLRDGQAIAGESATRYIVTEADQGSTIACAETATNGHGSTTQSSNALGIVPIVDEDVSFWIVGRNITLKVSRKGIAKAFVRCGPGELSGPCEGKLTIQTRKKFGKKALAAAKGRKSKKRLKLGSRRFSAEADQRVKVKVKIKKKKLRLLKRRKKARKVRIKARVRDQAGHSDRQKKRAKIKLKRRKRK